MIKKTLAGILIICSLLSIWFPLLSTATDNSYATIPVVFNNVKMDMKVLIDSDDSLLVPVSWLTYFGLMECKETDTEYEFFYPEQKTEDTFARRIFISKNEPYKLSSCYYLDNEGLFSLISERYSFITDVLGYSFEMFKDGKGINDYVNAIGAYRKELETERIRDNYVPVYESSFTKSVLADGVQYFPLEELIPLINAKVGISDDNSLCIASNASSLSKALYGSNIGSLIFDADTYLATGRNTMNVISYVSSSLSNLRFDRLDFICKTGEIKDYQTIFTQFLMDDENYLKAFDTASPMKKEADLAQELLSGVDTAFGFIDKIKLSDDDSDISLLKILEAEETLRSEDFHFWKDFSGAAEFIGTVSDYAEFWYSYLYHVKDHKEMLGAVYEYNIRTASGGTQDINDVPAYIAVQNVQDLYDESISTAAVAKSLSSFQDSIMKDITKNATSKYTTLTSAISLTTSLLNFVDSTKQALDIMDEGVLVNYMDASANKSYDVFLTRLNSERFDAKSLNELRLCAIMALVASKNCYEINILEGLYTDKVDRINETLTKLYLASDGIECESSDYYISKCKELGNKMNLLAESSESNDKRTVYTSEKYGWTVTLTEDYAKHCLIVENGSSVFFMLKETQEYVGGDVSYDGLIFCINAFEKSYEVENHSISSNMFYIASDEKYNFYCQFPNGITYNIDDPEQVELMERMRGTIPAAYGAQITGQIKEILDSFVLSDYNKNNDITSEQALQKVREIVGYDYGLIYEGTGEKDNKEYHIIRMRASTDGGISSTIQHFFVSVDGTSIVTGDYRNGIIYFY